MALRGESGTAYIGDVRIGTITAWEHTIATNALGEPTGIQLTCRGRFATAWQRLGAQRAMVRTAPRRSALKPMKAMLFVGDIQTLTAKTLVLVNVKQERME